MTQDNPTRPHYEATPDSLANQFLIAMPHLKDPWFNQTVTYLWRHSDEGALGIVINKPSNMCLVDLLEELKISIEPRKGDIEFHSRRVMTGGPVEKNKGFILHNSGREWEHTLPITPELSLSMSKDILEDIALGVGPERYLVALGCAGWEAGQLEQEIGNNVWLTVPAAPEIIFSSNHSKKADAAASILGINLDQLSSTAGHS